LAVEYRSLRLVTSARIRSSGFDLRQVTDLPMTHPTCLNIHPIGCWTNFLRDAFASRAFP